MLQVVQPQFFSIWSWNHFVGQIFFIIQMLKCSLIFNYLCDGQISERPYIFSMIEGAIKNKDAFKVFVKKTSRKKSALIKSGLSNHKKWELKFRVKALQSVKWPCLEIISPLKHINLIKQKIEIASNSFNIYEIKFKLIN